MTLRTLIISALLLALSACGFHLRGATPLPEVMGRTYLSAPVNSPLRYELESLLLSAGAEVTNSADGASAVLTVHGAQTRQRTLSLDALGRAQEYALGLSVQYSLVAADGRTIAQNQSVRVERDLRFDPDNVLAIGAEREIVQQEMYRAAAQQILRHLRSLARDISPADGTAAAQ